jgi:predicted amidohydrolase
MGPSMRVAGAQIAVTADINENVARIARAIDEAADAGADILLTPEGAVSAYHWVFDASATAAGVEALRRHAVERAIGLALGTCFEDGDARYDEIRFYTRDGGLAGVHAKRLLCKRVSDPVRDDERDHFGTLPLGSIRFSEGLTVGGLVCNDLWANPECTPEDDPHLLVQLARRGARIVFHAANTGTGVGAENRLHRAFHDSNLRLRARAAGVCVVTVDAADASGREMCNAPSGVIDNEGRWVVRAPARGEALFVADIALTLETPAPAVVHLSSDLASSSVQ